MTTGTPLHLAFVSYEYPPDTSGGGIATSLANTARMHAERGHRVEVFVGSPHRTESTTEDGVQVHRVQVADRAELAQAVVPAFRQRHATDPFDLVEGPEYGADARAVHAAFPNVPLVVKLRTSKSMISAINHRYLSLGSKARFLAGGLRRGRLPRPYWRYDRAGDAERTHALGAAAMVAPSHAIKAKAVEFWGADPSRIWVAPHPYAPSDALLDLALGGGTDVLFYGKLEVRKGVVELAHAAREVVEARPETRFRFVGGVQTYPGTGEDLRDVMRRALGPPLATPRSRTPCRTTRSRACWPARPCAPSRACGKASGSSAWKRWQPAGRSS